MRVLTHTFITIWTFEPSTCSICPAKGLKRIIWAVWIVNTAYAFVQAKFFFYTPGFFSRTSLIISGITDWTFIVYAKEVVRTVKINSTITTDFGAWSCIVTSSIRCYMLTIRIKSTLLALIQTQRAVWKMPVSTWLVIAGRYTHVRGGCSVTNGIWVNVGAICILCTFCTSPWIA